MNDDIIKSDATPVSDVKVQPIAQVVDPDLITEAYITDDGEITTKDEIFNTLLKDSMRCFNTDGIGADLSSEARIDVKKYVEGSNQQVDELVKFGEIQLAQIPVVTPPYPPELLSKFLEVDETHFRCVKTKVTDSIGRDWDIMPATSPDGRSLDLSTIEPKLKKQIEDEILIVRNFIDDCNDIIGFDGVCERSAMDYEGLGWGAIEVIRSRDKKIARLAHVPASRLRVLKGWQGFVEIIGPSKYVYYQNFGQKLISRDRGDAVSRNSAYYNPREDGPLKNAKWNFIDKNTGKSTSSFVNSANEILWIPKHHSNTIYYGMADVIPALGHILANIHIRDYFLQFFEYNAVPQYAIIIKGGKLTPEVKQVITKFFSEEVKGKAHKTLILPIPATGGDVDVKFEKLSVDVKEGSFQLTRKNNSQGIMTSHGVSPAIIGVNDAASLGSGKGMSQAAIYKDRIVTPSQKRWASALNKLFRLGLGISLVKLEFDPLDISDMQAEAILYGSYLDKGALSINDVRKFAKLGDPIEGGERAFIKLGNNISFVEGLENADMKTVNDTNSEIDMLKLELKKRSLEKPATPVKPKGKK